MRIPSHASSGEVGVNMTPLIDVVFQLILFFLVTGHLARLETHLPLPLPRAGSGELPGETSRPRVTINVLAGGQMLLGARPMTVAELEARLAEERAAAGGNLEVRIRSDRAAPYKHIEPILRAAARAGLWNITFSVHRAIDR